MDEARGLHEILDEEDQDFNARVVWAAVYDPPQKVLWVGGWAGEWESQGVALGPFDGRMGVIRSV